MLLGRVMQVWAMITATIAFVLLLIPSGILALPFKSLHTRLTVVGPFWRLFGHSILRISSLSRLTIIDHRSKDFQMNLPPALFICNHQSMFDIPLLLTCFAIPPIMKIEVLRIPIFGMIANACGAIAVDRNDKQSRAKVFKTSKLRLLDNFPVQYYPEGTRSKIKRPKPYEEIKTSLLSVAYENNIPVICCSGYGTRGVIDRKSRIYPFKKVGMIIHQEVHPRNYADKELFFKACWNLVIQGYDQLESQLS